MGKMGVSGVCEVVNVASKQNTEPLHFLPLLTYSCSSLLQKQPCITTCFSAQILGNITNVTPTKKNTFFLSLSLLKPS